MDIFHFLLGYPPTLASAETHCESDGFFWLDVERSETNWHERAQKCLGTHFHESHVRDSLNATHMPYFDGTDDYDMLIVRALCPNCPPGAPTTHPITCLITANAVVSVRPPGDPIFQKLHQRFLNSQRNSPTSPAMLLYLLLDQVTDTLLTHRDATSDVLTSWQDRLLDGNDGFQDWQALMRLRRQVRHLEVVAEDQLDIQDEWRKQTALPIDQSLTVHFNDLQEHLRRVYNHAIVVQHDIDGLVQIYFSAKTHQNNQILQFLTVVSAIFLPLNLLAGVFGMNFVYLPLLQAKIGPWAVLGLMILVITALLFWFRQRRWI